MKVNIICGILAQITYLGKIWFLRYGPKRSWPINCRILKSMKFLGQNNEKPEKLENVSGGHGQKGV